jgi:tetratricopeptide (TPR) repeat protein
MPRTITVSTVSGTAGVGKTALALHWAHRAAGHFPDGQLYINLRGFDPTGSPPVTVEEAIRMFLDAFEIPVSRIPATPQGQIALYRSVLAGRRVLVVLDNARDAAQVRPLLPGAPGCLAVITSRNQLPGLVAAEGARPIRLDLPTMDESRALMTSRIGRTRAAAETAAIDDIIRLCARLPLALVIAAARAATHHESPLAVLAKELQQSHGSLAAFSGPDSMTDVPAVFSLSYRALTGAAAQLFRLLGVHPGPDISVAAAASLAGIPPPALRPLLAELAGAHLITESSPGRYALHDLLRAYAHEQAQIHDAGKDRGDAVRRILDHYLHTAYAAAELMYRGPKLLTLTPPQRGVVPETLADHGQALAWLGAEDRVLVSVLQQAAGSGLHDFAWKLGWTVGYFFNLRGRLPEAVQVQQIALASAERLADPHAQASCHRSLGDAFTKLRSGAQASVHLRQAVDLAEQMGDHNSQAHAHLLFAILLEQQHRQPEALRHAQAAFDLYAISGESWGQARSLINIGWLNVQIGDHRQAIAQGERALELTRGLADRFGEAATWDTIGYAHFHLGNLRQAVGCYEAALGLLTDLGHRYHEATVLDHLGDADHSMGNQARARDAWQRALRILDDIDHADAPRVRAKLHGADAP